MNDFFPTFMCNLPAVRVNSLNFIFYMILQANSVRWSVDKISVDEGVVLSPN